MDLNEAKWSARSLSRLSGLNSSWTSKGWDNRRLASFQSLDFCEKTLIVLSFAMTDLCLLRITAFRSLVRNFQRHVRLSLLILYCSTSTYLYKEKALCRQSLGNTAFWNTRLSNVCNPVTYVYVGLLFNCELLSQYRSVWCDTGIFSST